jgi:hypothetical protein
MVSHAGSLQREKRRIDGDRKEGGKSRRSLKAEKKVEQIKH